MPPEADSTPLTEDLADIAANEGVAPSPESTPPKKKPGRKPKYPPGHPKSRAGERRNGGGGKKSPPNPPPPPEMPEMPEGMEPPFSPTELRDVMVQVGAALFSLPGEAMAARVLKRNPDRPDWAVNFLLPPEQAAMGGKAVVWYVTTRFPDIFAKWGPEVMLAGTFLAFYGPRIVLMTKDPPPLEEKPPTVHAKAA